MAKLLLVSVVCVLVLSSPAKAQLLGGAGMFTVSSTELSNTFTFPTLRVSVGYPAIPVVLGMEYGTTHWFTDPWSGDDVVSTIGYSLSVKIYRFLGLEVAHNSVEQSHILENDGIYVSSEPSFSTYSVSLLLFSRDMSHLSIGYTTKGLLQLGAHVQVFGAEDWREIIGGDPKK